MKLLPLEFLGSHPNENVVNFGLLLPWVSRDHGNRLFVKIIHEKDQFLQNIRTHRFELQHSVNPDYGDYWSGEFLIDKADKKSIDSMWGENGRYVYRYELESPLLSQPLDWIVDPFAREFGLGRQAAFTMGYEQHVWPDSEKKWKTPHLKDLIIYEMMLNEFAPDIRMAIRKLKYLQDLGINCIELMPVANVYRSVDWGYEPIGLFGPDERFGTRKKLQKFIECAHNHGIAVILDMVYGHTGDLFAYEYVYRNLKYETNPFMGAFAMDRYGNSTDFNREFTRDFYFTVNYFWLEKFHADGIRYDCVPNYYDGPVGKGYSDLVYNTWKKVKETDGNGYWQRFFRDGTFNLIQCAENLDNPVEILEKTYTNCTWQDQTISNAWEIANGDFGKLFDFGMQLGLSGYPELEIAEGVKIEKTALQYIENHDHPRFLCAFGTTDLYQNIFREGERENWYKTIPFAAAILLAKGIPMLWQGQEIAENYDVPDSGPARIGTFRPVRWENFYSEEGIRTIRMYRKLINLRVTEEVFRKGSYYFINDWEKYQSKGILIFTRQIENTIAIIALNFSSVSQNAELDFVSEGSYFEQIEQMENFLNVNPGEKRNIEIPAYSARVWLKKVMNVPPQETILTFIEEEEERIIM